MKQRDIPIISDVNGLLEAFEEFMRRKPLKMRNAYWRAFQAAWQASRECMVIELPEPRVARGYGEQVADALGFNDAINYCEEAIHAAGVKTK